ncbi:MAG: dTDP-4-dehydrorhamnose reductase [Maribacter sp.]
MKRILVTGANGQLGQCLQKISSTYSELEFSFFNSKQLDITKANTVTTIFALKDFDYCINCAAYTNVEQAESTPEIAYMINASGVKNLALSCQDKNVVLIHISTDYVFDGEKNEPYTVEDIPNPINEYGKSKLLGENHIQEILHKFFIIRTSWLYSEFGDNFYKTILKKAQKGESIFVTDNQIGSPTNANNLASYILNFISKKPYNYGIRHYTDRESMTWYEFAKKILSENNLVDKAKLVKDKNYRTFAKRPKNSVLYH